MRILVTGGAGFIASHVADAFVAAGHEVWVVDNLSTGRRENVPAGARFSELDLLDPKLIELVAEFRPDCIDHHAAHADVFESVKDPVNDARVNVLGTVALLHAAAQASVGKFIFISSGGAIYGEPEQFPCNEEHPARPISPYAAAKLAGENYLHTFGRVHGLDYTVLRYPNIYGPRQHPYTEEGQVVPLFARLMLAGRQPTIFGDGEQARDFLYVGDVVRANELALERGAGQVLNLGTGEAITINSLYRSLQVLTGYEAPPRYGPGRAGEVYRIALDASRAGQELGWRPQTSFDDGLRATVEWVRANPVIASS
ncbi:MAG: NAD-dependent epimerase/dehydratase family protein [Chloroflexi bacterium]|nr:NAD-dependent epimerase/dehydratase family protein [Chloroflexota bacterium]